MTAMKSDEKFDFAVFGPTVNFGGNVTGTIKFLIYQKTIDEMSEMLGKPIIDKKHGSGMIVQGFMLESEFNSTVNKFNKR